MRLISLFWLLALLLIPCPAQAYIGPGAGFALISSFFILITATLLALFTILTLPLRTVYLLFRRRKIRRLTRARRVIVLGFDGLDPEHCREYMAAGRLPNLERLSQRGTFSPLTTTTPSISPVAWSSFATGVNPGKHRIFDFFTRDPRNYQPVLSSALISTRKQPWALGPFKFASLKTTVKLLRRSTSFWKLLGRHKIFSTILRVPITFPPEKFYGACLSAMCAPDLRGTQGSFTLFTAHQDDIDRHDTKGEIVPLISDKNGLKADIPGPLLKSDAPALTIPLRCTPLANNSVLIRLPNTEFTLRPKEYSPWLQLAFKIRPGKKVYGIARFLLTSTAPIRIYMTPINIDPEHPSLPISHPFYYSICLAKLHGSFATLGLAEDTWALNEGVIDEDDFLRQAYDICTSRETVFLDNLRKSREGLLVSVFDTTDRIQHMFYRYLDDDHPANQGRDTKLHKEAIAHVYERSDRLAGRVMAEITDDDLLLIISDHGFKPFKWGINLNTWLWREGYLILKEGKSTSGQWLQDVDWGKTRAYAIGLTGLFINTKGRERQGIVKKGREREVLLAELKDKLEALDADGHQPIRRAILAGQALHGPYVRDAPDILPGFRAGYRVSWNSAAGRTSTKIIEPNTKRWSGDHCLDPELVPGVLFSNWLLAENEQPALIDLAPTIMNIFGLPAERFHDGRILDIKQPAAAK